MPVSNPLRCMLSATGMTVIDASALLRDMGIECSAANLRHWSQGRGSAPEPVVSGMRTVVLALVDASRCEGALTVRNGTLHDTGLSLGRGAFELAAGLACAANPGITRVEWVHG